MNRCVCEECYQEVYGDDPLEDGEIDPERSRTFTACTRRVYRERKRKRERERRGGKVEKVEEGGEGGGEEEDVGVVEG